MRAESKNVTESNTFILKFFSDWKYKHENIAKLKHFLDWLYKEIYVFIGYDVIRISKN